MGLGFNLAASSRATAGFLPQIEELLKRHRTAAARLWIEVAKTGVLKHVDAFRRLCHALRGFRCQIGVDGATGPGVKLAAT